MAAYGLYSHIQSNKRRSIALLSSALFFLVYVMVYAGASARLRRFERQSAARRDHAPRLARCHRPRCLGPRSARCSGFSSPNGFTSR